jgi:hypothetical protein
VTETGTEPRRAEGAEALSREDGEATEDAEVLVWNGLVAKPSERPPRMWSSTFTYRTPSSSSGIGPGCEPPQRGLRLP